MSRKRRDHDHYVIYRATNTQNNKSYIGQTYDFDNRKRQHIADAHGKHKNRQAHAFQSAIAKYGEDKFTWTIIAEFDNVEDCNKAEEALIAQLNTLAPNGYNLQPGGKNKRASLETRKKISETLKRVGTILSNKGPAHPNYGRVYTEEQSRRQSERLSGINGPGAKLTAELVRQIYMEVYNGATMKVVACKYELKSHSTVMNIMHKRSWKKELADLPVYETPRPYNSKLKEADIYSILQDGYELGLLKLPGEKFKYTKEQSRLFKMLTTKYNAHFSVVYNILRGGKQKNGRAAKLYQAFIAERKLQNIK